jgi:hypothetical protein
VVAVAGNTVTLSSTVDATQFYSVIGSFDGQAGGSNIIVDLNAPGSVGQLIANAIVLPLSRGAIITNVRFVWVRVGRGAQKRKVYDISQAIATDSILATAESYIELLALSTTFGIYQFSGIPSATYNFVSTNGNYTFRANAYIPYGSYPGIGAFSA